MSESVVFLHGAGAAGPAAWPQQIKDAPEAWTFLARQLVSDPPGEDAQRIMDQLGATGPGHVVAHSFGSIAAVLVAQQSPNLVRSLTLIEPACFDLARGRQAVEEHISAMAPVLAMRNDPAVSAREFSSRFASAMGADPPDLPDDVLEIKVARLRSMVPPWGSALRVEAGLPVSTFVLTGDWSSLYEETAEALVSFGAVHERMGGFGHRVQDHPRASSRMAQHWASVPKS